MNWDLIEDNWKQIKTSVKNNRVYINNDSSEVKDNGSDALDLFDAQAEKRVNKLQTEVQNETNFFGSPLKIKQFRISQKNLTVMPHHPEKLALFSKKPRSL